MTRKDYKALARLLYLYKYGGYSWGDFLTELCLYLKQDNPNFDKDKFLEATCGK